ncbi:MAG: electron transfer flavoprotein subunit alpha/FixB family protein [Gemmatimonadota bacterium]|nr:MAG: electron transfer flavoprotein subunit alpha/FixB family protein [Gemmatimonadota bacterium]
MSDILTVLEQREGVVKRVSHEALAAARALADELGCEVHALVIGPPDTDVTGLGQYGADKVMTSLDEELTLYQASRYAQIAADQAMGGAYTTVILGATSLGKDLGPRIAARLGCPLTSDVTSISGVDGIVVTRPVFAGKAIYRLKITGSPSVITVRPNAVAPVAASNAGVVEEVSASDDVKPAVARTLEVRAPDNAALDVAEAAIVVAGGRGLKEAEHFKLVEGLAQALGGAVGASRAVVDAGWRPHSEQVGQTGKTVSPNLYIALGISGAIQHLAGMRTAKVIVAINKDPDAPIFKVADYGIVGDVFEVVPRLTEAIVKAREG